MTPPFWPIPPDNRILFFRRDREFFGYLSNFHEAEVTIDGEIWRSTEFYYQAQKSYSSEYRDAIRQASSPGHAKGLGTDPRKNRQARKRSWFTTRPEKMRTDWGEVKLGIMTVALNAKFRQHEELRWMLLATADAELVEDSRHDAFWGIGKDEAGMNWLGRLLMELRQQLATNEGRQDQV